MLKAAYTPYQLKFNFRALTSRGALPVKDTYFIKVWDSANPDKSGLGECALFKGLSKEDTNDYESVLYDLCRKINSGQEYDISGLSSIKFGMETALADFDNDCIHTPFPGKFSRGESDITINGLVWMGSLQQMNDRARQKIAEGFQCVKFKIGSENFDEEFRLLEQIRKIYGYDSIEIRLDANGAFTPENALDKLRRLSALRIHSIEQPIKAGQWESMADLCADSPIPIALDEELIGCRCFEDKCEMLAAIKPSYIILKPSLCGGFAEANEWIKVAESRNIGWWATSALESNIGLNAIAQWVDGIGVNMPQGLGTGGLYTNNISSPLVLNGEKLHYGSKTDWNLPDFQWIIP